MKRKNESPILIFIIFSLLIFNCKKTTESESNLGNADFTSFVAIGNSLTAGVGDGALYETSQKNSFPNLIAKMAEVDDDFEQPIMGGNGFSFNETEGRLQPNIFSATPSIDFLEAGTENNRNLNRPYNNLGIPLIQAGQLYTAITSVEADSNHFVDKILRGSGRNAIQEALFLNPTLITLWIGNNDVLESATLGLANNDSQYTIATEFSAHITTIVNQLTDGTNAPIFIANIIDITDLPYFTSLPSFVIDPTNGQKTYLYGECESGPRELTDDDLVLFWALPDYFNYRANIGSVSVANALNDTVILDVEEKAEIRALISDYNDIIADAANSHNQLYLVDMHSLFQDIAQNGYIFDGVQYSSDIKIFNSEGVLNVGAFSTTLFSYDALHPIKYGYASFANSFIEVINSSLNAEIPLISTLLDLN
ncbi:MAG: SGNH/GDSL hydrolase family protein [Candidatus Neomarinimicrobiota bacterium]